MHRNRQESNSEHLQNVSHVDTPEASILRPEARRWYSDREGLPHLPRQCDLGSLAFVCPDTLGGLAPLVSSSLLEAAVSLRAPFMNLCAEDHAVSTREPRVRGAGRPPDATGHSCSRA